MAPAAASPPLHPGLPQFDVRLDPPDLSPWIAGNTGIPGFTTISAALPGPHVVLIGLIHGNELAGAIILDQLLRAGLQPHRGRITFGFANLTAFQRFDPRQPTASRFVDEDLNRVWDDHVLDGSRQSSELTRARAIRPLIDTADILLDLHSMLWPSDPLILCGVTAKGRQLAAAIGTPGLVVADRGHVSGRRLIDYSRFIHPTTPHTAILVEAGQHWEPQTLDITLACVAGLLRHTGQISQDELPAPAAPATTAGFAEVTTVVTASTGGFAFVQPFRGGDILPRRNTLIALDGQTEIRTPHDNCLLVMPSLRPSRGHTAVRLARLG